MTIPPAGTSAYAPTFDYKRDGKVNRVAKPGSPAAFDTCQTPPYALDPLLPYLRGDWMIWEPACGDSLLVEGFHNAGFEVLATDVRTGQNFLEYEPLPGRKWDAIITNPPYSLKFPWLKRCYELGKPFALLLPVETLGAKKAQDLMKQYGVEILLLNRRVNFHMPNKGWSGSGAQFSVLWLCWQLLPDTLMYGEITRKGARPRVIDQIAAGEG